jgi:type II secretory ATPase GspE/PulE/Tfp pilus assembly ATPase PilB-like protein
MQAGISSAFEGNLYGLLLKATSLGASDIHIEPRLDGIRFRARVDGSLREIQEIKNPRILDHFAMTVKRSCGFDMSKLNVPQDARFSLRGLPYDFRASLIPTMYGEKIVVRCLEQNKDFSLEKYALPSEAKSYLYRVLGKWQGLILVSGPTGSGKTTLLYSLLAELDRRVNNVHTLEDPIEYTLEGVVQTQINPPEVSFERALRALLRQDPDCILVGEIRDSETAQAALHAASTGHLIFSTIHANSAEECIERLVGLGLDRRLVETNLLFASAQRLVPKNCTSCLVEEEDSEFSFKTYAASGCEACGGEGVRGLGLLFEYVGKSFEDKDGPRLRRFGSLEESALQLLKKGEISAKSAAAFCH